MTRRTLHTALAAAMALAATAAGATQAPTPEIHRIEQATGNGTTAYIMRASLPDSAQIVGIALTCDTRAEVRIYLGAFPPAGTPVQLAVRTANGDTERFGPVINHDGPRSGFHDPLLNDQQQVARFLDAALENGALVSNGYNSFWNRVAPGRNLEVRDIMRRCGA